MINRLICKIFGHKYTEGGKKKNYTWAAGSTWCMRCRYDRMSEQRIYFSDGQADITKWDAPEYIALTKTPDAKYIAKFDSRVKKAPKR